MIDQIRSLGDVPASEKAVILSSLTVRPIPLQDLENLLDSEQLAWRDEITSQWNGSLIVAMDSGSPVSEGLSELFRHLNKIRSVHIETDKPEWAVKCSALLDGLIYLGLLTVEQKGKVLALGGGRKHGDVTVEDVETWEAVAASQDARQQLLDDIGGLVAEIMNDYVRPAEANNTPVEELRNLIKQGL